MWKETPGDLRKVKDIEIVFGLPGTTEDKTNRVTQMLWVKEVK